MEFNAHSVVWIGLVAIVSLAVWRMIAGWLSGMSGTESLGKAMAGLTG